MTTNVDSLDKIVKIYFACVTNEAFTYKDTTFEPKELYVSPLLLRGYTCPAMCGGCCPRFSLDYLPFEQKPDIVQERIVTFNDRQFSIYSDMQSDHKNKKCRNLDMSNGRCNIHKVRPFSCDFELIRFLVSGDQEKRKNVLTQKLFGRGWMMQRVDGERGALCEMTPIDPESISDNIRKLNRLKEWTNYFGIKTKTDAIINWIQSQEDYNKMKPLLLDKDGNVM